MTERKGLPTPVADLAGLIGQEIGVSRWITVDQARDPRRQLSDRSLAGGRLAHVCPFATR